MIESAHKYKWFLLGILFLLLVALLSSYIVNQRTEDLESTIRIQLAEQQALLSTIAETTARNGADSITESIVRDCAIDDRSRFNKLLGSLDSVLPRYELIELEQLFVLCGNFYSERKAVMVSRFAREIGVYGSYVEQLSSLTGKKQNDNYSLDQWKSLIANEEVQSDLFSTLVRSQKKIIDTLLEGRAADSEEIGVILSQVRETKEALILSKTQADKLRAELTAL